MAVLGAPGTTINGSTNPFVTSRTVTNIVANLNGGNDAIGFTNSAQGAEQPAHERRPSDTLQPGHPASRDRLGRSRHHHVHAARQP